MTDLHNIKLNTLDRPTVLSGFDFLDNYDNLPKEHKDQIFLLDKEASKFIYSFLDNSKMTDKVNPHNYDGKTWKPFPPNFFKTVEEFTNFSDFNLVKKWLFKTGIPFKTNVFILPNYGEQPILTTWKIVLKYAEDIFFNDDIIIFDQTLNWCLYFFHHDHLYYGKGNIFDPETEYSKMHELNLIKQKYPNFKFPF
jgi:hypothetical protein